MTRKPVIFPAGRPLKKMWENRTRQPLLLFLLLGLFLLRRAQRALSSLLFQDPPRSARISRPRPQYSDRSRWNCQFSKILNRPPTGGIPICLTNRYLVWLSYTLSLFLRGQNSRISAAQKPEPMGENRTRQPQLKSQSLGLPLRRRAHRKPSTSLIQDPPRSARTFVLFKYSVSHSSSRTS